MLTNISLHMAALSFRADEGTSGAGRGGTHHPQQPHHKGQVGLLWVHGGARGG